MANLPRKDDTGFAYRRDSMPVHTASLHSIFLIYGWVLILHCGFAAILTWNDYVLHNWVLEVLPLWDGDDYFSLPWWLYVYIPAFIFVYGFFELSPFFRLLKARKHLSDAKILMVPRMVSNLHVLNSLGLLSFIAVALLTVVGEDRFGIHMLTLILWGSYMKIGAIIGPRF